MVNDLDFYVVKWKVKPVNPKAGYGLSFLGTEMFHKDWGNCILKQPRNTKIGSRKKRKGCIAMLVDFEGKTVYRIDEKQYRIMLPINYEQMEEMYKKDFFQKNSYEWFLKSKY